MDNVEDSGKVKVCCRIRPVDTTREATPFDVQDRCVHIQPCAPGLARQSGSSAAAQEGSSSRGYTKRRRRRDRWGFTFDDILEDGCSQEEVYNKCAKDTVQSVLAGVNGTVMAYGCTGAGKSYTMMGGERADRAGVQDGICARALQDALREASRRRKNGEVISMQMSFVEVYNEQLFDLLLPPETFLPSRSQHQRRFNVYGGNGGESALDAKRSTPVSSVQKLTMDIRGSASAGGLYTPPGAAGAAQLAPELTIYERPDGSTYVKESQGLTLHEIKSEDHALKMLRVGKLAREVAEHQFNRASSRSHAVLTVHVTMRTNKNCVNENEEDGRERQTEREEVSRQGLRGGIVTTSKLNLVDLAGNEKSVTSPSAGDAVLLHREGRFINKSLAFLEQVTIALADQRREHVPFRSSRLTHFLKDSLGGNCRTLMIACIWPRPDLLQQSLATLKFAARMRCVKNAPIINERSWSARDELVNLRGQVEELKAQLALRDQPRVVYDEASATDVAMSSRRRCVIWDEVGRFVMAMGHVSREEDSRRAKEMNCREGLGLAFDTIEKPHSEGESCDSDRRCDENCLFGTPSESGEIHRNIRDSCKNTEVLSPGTTTGEIGEQGCGRNQGYAKRRRRRTRGGERSLSPSSSTSMSPPEMAPNVVQKQPRCELSTSRHVREFCFALRELVWEAAAAAAEITSSGGKKGDRNDEGLSAGGTRLGTTTSSGSRGDGESAVAAARLAIQVALERNSGSSRESLVLGASKQEDREPQRKTSSQRGECPDQKGRAASNEGISNEGTLEKAKWGLVTAAPVTGCEEGFLRGDDDEGDIIAVTAMTADNTGERCRALKRTLREAGKQSLPPSNDTVNIAEDCRVEMGSVNRGAHDSAGILCGGDFERFKAMEGKLMHSRLQDAKVAVRQGCVLANELARRVNDAKGRIDSTLAQLQHQEQQQQGREENRGEQAGEMEESVKHVLLAQLKRRKREYRDIFEKLAEAKASLRNSKQDKQEALAALAAEFQSKHDGQITKSNSCGSARSSNSTGSSDGDNGSGLGNACPVPFLPQLPPANSNISLGKDNDGDGTPIGEDTPSTPRHEAHELGKFRIGQKSEDGCYRRA